MDSEPLPPVPNPVPAPLRPGYTPEQLLPIIGESNRYRLLGILIDGAPHSAAELGRTLNKGQAATSKHLASLRAAGIIELCDHARDRRTTCYRMVRAFVPAEGAPRELDFGWCVLRFPL